MDQGTLLAIGAIAAVVVLAMLLRAGKGGDAEVRPPAAGEGSGAATRPGAGSAAADDGDEHDDRDDEEDDEDDWDRDEVVAVTSDGYALLPDVHAVRLLPPPEEGEEWKTGETARPARAGAAISASWNAGDFTGGRVVRGGGEDPWRLEALGRDGEFIVFSFETREAADAALRLFEKRGVIRLGEDDDGHPVPPSAEQFAEARRIYEETEQALAMEPGAEEDERP